MNSENHNNLSNLQDISASPILPISDNMPVISDDFEYNISPDILENNYVLNLRGFLAYISKTDFEWLPEDFFIKGLIFFTNNENKVIFINEDPNSAISIIDSIIFNRLTILNGTSISYLSALADKWCAPEWLSEEIEKHKNKKNVIDIVSTCLDNICNNNIKLCYLCKTAFNSNTNNPTACIHHSSYYSSTNNMYTCCGSDIHSEGCKVSHHIEDLNYVKEKLYTIRNLPDVVYGINNKE